ncbi:mycothiol transferase, partial [Streptomyces violascens]|uniref:mycothiol transferase n=1 Tax=Streptomyces violascens TaxID=67381 RepID=UPI0035712C57
MVEATGAGFLGHVGQIPAGLGVLGFVRDVLLAQDDVVGKAVQRLVRPGQAQGSHPAEAAPDMSAGRQPTVCRDLLLFLEAGQAVGEGRDVQAGQGSWGRSVVRPLLPQAVGELGHRVDDVLDGAARVVAAALGQVIVGPAFHRLTEPGLADAGEAEEAAAAEGPAVPGVFVPFGLRREVDQGLAMKCEGLDDEQAAIASVPPSGFTLTGLVQHMA